MKIIVCIKVVLDPEAPSSLFKVDEATKTIIPPRGTPPVLNPFDENALEAALRIKNVNNSSITVISLGKNLPKPVIRKSLAYGADNLILLEDELFDDLDSYSTSEVIVRAIRKIGDYDLILCGREAADTDAGQVGLGIAEMLCIPSVSLASKMVEGQKTLKVEKVLADGTQTIEVPLPALVTVSNEVGTIRTATMKGIMEAQKKPLTTWNAKDLGITQPLARKSNLFKLFQPVKGTNCEMFTANTPEEAAAKLAQRLKEVKSI
jgi:electron transfer flavoprotein beta subunit